MDVQLYIASGILETYLIGAATPAEEREILYLKDIYPEINEALRSIETNLELFALEMAVSPPPGTWNKIEAEIDGIIAREETRPAIYKAPGPKYGYAARPDIIDVQGLDTHMRIHKNWKWVLAAIFILGKIFLACAIYFYLENRQTQSQINELKIEIQQLKH